MKAVFKFSLYPGVTECTMPVGAMPLCVQTQNERPCLWVLANPGAPTAIRRFVIYVTGQPITDPDRLWYIGTCQMDGGALVWHVFEAVIAPPTQPHTQTEAPHG